MEGHQMLLLQSQVGSPRWARLGCKESYTNTQQRMAAHLRSPQVVPNHVGTASLGATAGGVLGQAQALAIEQAGRLQISDLWHQR